MDVNGRHYSRFQVLGEGQPAWAVGSWSRWFYYDGQRFWWVHESGEHEAVASWRTPSSGWAHDRHCACHLCLATERAARELRAA